MCFYTVLYNFLLKLIFFLPICESIYLKKSKINQWEYWYFGGPDIPPPPPCCIWGVWTPPKIDTKTRENSRSNLKILYTTDFLKNSQHFQNLTNYPHYNRVILIQKQEKNTIFLRTVCNSPSVTLKMSNSPPPTPTPKIKK